jgi:hypothetical protein
VEKERPVCQALEAPRTVKEGGIIMDEIQSYRMHPKMTKGLLDQIDNLQKTNHTTDEIAATLGITPEAVERGFEKLADRKKTLAHSLRGGAFAVVMRADKPRLACNEKSCPWRCNAKDYCVWPSCFKQTITSKPIYPTLDDDELALSADDDVVPAVPVATEGAING